MKLNLVPARTGLNWVRQGMKTFFRQPLALSGLFFMFMAVASVLSVLPLVGLLLVMALIPSATIGLMSATREADGGRFPMPVQLLTAFRSGHERRRDMLVLGALYVGALVALVVLAALFTSGPTGNLTPPESPQATQAMVEQAISDPGFWLAMLLYVPLLMAFWHAPALVLWHGVSPVKSLFFSLMACWRNRGAMLVYALGWLGVFLVAGLLLSLVAGLLGGSVVTDAAAYPLALFLASMFHASIYFSFRDSFVIEDADGGPAGEAH